MQINKELIELFVASLQPDERKLFQEAIELACKKPQMTIGSSGTKEWRLDGKLHRTDGPAIEFADGSKFWYIEGKLHRTDGPAEEYADGTKYWYTEDKLHRTDGPAVEHADGTKSWYIEGKRHRTDGPAAECANGTKWWYLNGVQVTEAAVMCNSCEGKVVEIEGKKYKLTAI